MDVPIVGYPFHYREDIDFRALDLLVLNVPSVKMAAVDVDILSPMENGRPVVGVSIT